MFRKATVLISGPGEIVFKPAVPIPFPIP
jgi:hypothetical protein